MTNIGAGLCEKNLSHDLQPVFDKKIVAVVKRYLEGVNELDAKAWQLQKCNV